MAEWLADNATWTVIGEQVRVGAAHSFRFAGAVKTSKTAETRIYGIESSPTDQ